MDAEFRAQTGLSLVPLLNAAIAIYAILTISHWVILPPNESRLMAAFAGLSTIILISLRVLARRWQSLWALQVTVFVVAVAALNSLLHLWVTEDIKHSSNLALVIVGTGYVVLPLRWLVSLLVIQLTGWLLVVEFRDQELVHYGFMLTLSICVALLLNRARVTSARHAVVARRDEERFRATFEANGVGNFILDEAGQILAVNSAAVGIFRQDANDLRGRMVEELLAHESVPEWEELFERLTNGWVRTARTEMLGMRSQGDEFPMQISAEVMLLEYGFLEFAVNIIDLSELKELQRQLLQSQRLEAVGQLTGGIAHDFNNLLQVVISEAGVARRNLPQGSTEDEALRSVLDASDRASDLVRQLLTFSQSHPISMRTVDLNVVVADTLRLIKRTLGELISVRFHPSSLPAFVRVDVGMIEQVVTNLSINARDAMPQGGKLDISITRTPQTAVSRIAGTDSQMGRMCLEVTDNGCGMDEETVSRIFEPFFTTKTVGEGAGLGLSTVYGIVYQLGGEIRVESMLKKGTSFFIDLPEVADAQPPLVSRNQNDSSPGRGEVILLAEDNEPVLLGLANTLSDAGYRVITAENGREAVDAFNSANKKVDLLLFDVVMPTLSGVDAFQEIQQLSQETPVIFMTGYDKGKLQGCNFDDDMQRFISKPFKPEPLLSLVRDTLNSREAGTTQFSS